MLADLVPLEDPEGFGFRPLSGFWGLLASDVPWIIGALPCFCLHLYLLLWVGLLVSPRGHVLKAWLPPAHGTIGSGGNFRKWDPVEGS